MRLNRPNVPFGKRKYKIRFRYRYRIGELNHQSGNKKISIFDSRVPYLLHPYVILFFFHLFRIIEDRYKKKKVALNAVLSEKFKPILSSLQRFFISTFFIFGFRYYLKCFHRLCTFINTNKGKICRIRLYFCSPYK